MRLTSVLNVDLSFGRCGARVHSPDVACDLIGACASRYPSLSCPLARLVRAAPLPGWNRRDDMPTMTYPTTVSEQTDIEVTGGVGTHKDTTPPQHLTRPAGCWGTGSSRLTRLVTPPCWPGWARSGSWCGSG